MSKELKNCILDDLYRYSGKRSMSAFLRFYNQSEGFKFTVWLRLCHYYKKKRVTRYMLFPFCRFFYRHYRCKFGYDIPYEIEIGPGLLLYHFGGIVFSAQSCGKNMTISQNTTVGMTIHNGKKSYPVFGDGVYIAPGAAVIGGITVGNNVAIGTNCVLNKSVEDNAVVVGIPGRVISHNGSGEYVNYPIKI